MVAPTARLLKFTGAMGMACARVNKAAKAVEMKNIVLTGRRWCKRCVDL